MPISTAIDLGRVSRIVGYKVTPANFTPVTPYLPQRIAILGEANTANQSGLTSAPFTFITAKQVADKFGYGSPLHQMARILRPVSGDRLGGIETVIYPQVEASGATEAVLKLGVAVSTTVTKNATHKLIINGRDNIDGVPYQFSVVVGENAAAVRTKIVDAINAVISAPCTAAINVSDVDITTKWAGATAQLTVSIDTNNIDAGIVYSEISNTAGTGVISITDALTNFGEQWNTVVLNSYGATVFDALEAHNGVPDPENPSGRYLPTVFKPYVALYGSSLTSMSSVVAITNASARKTQVTNVHCPAPGSKGMPWEAAANMAIIYAPIAQNLPHLDNSGKYYPDMPVPADENIGDFGSSTGRDYMVKRGSSTVNLVAGRYTVQDFITTYAPDGEIPPKFRFVRDLNIDWNIAYNVLMIMQNSIQDNAIVADNEPTRVANVIKPKQAKQVYVSLITDLSELALIADKAFSENSLQVGINESNPARLDIFFKYKRTSTAHIVSTDAAVDFNFTT